MAEPVFIAPHFDDVALSCGATVAQLARASQPEIVTVFAGSPLTDSPVSGFAALQHEQWGLDSGNVIAARMAEDACAAAALGRGIQTRHLPFLDAIYRGDYYEDDRRLFGEIPEFEVSLVDDIADALLTFEAAMYFVPLAIGRHVDHQIVSRAARKLARSGLPVYGYEDLPYALVSDPEEIEAHQTRSDAVTVAVDAEAFDRKWAAISCYASQLPVIFRDLNAPREQFNAYARGAGGGRYAERFWPVPPAKL